MTLLLDRAVAAFDFTSAALVAPSDAALDASGSDGEIPVSVIGGNAAERDELRHPTADDRVRIPLHEPDSAELTGEFILYTDHALRGDLFLYADPDADGDDTAHISADDFRSTALADRMRFWHADHVPDESPPYHASPLDSREGARNPIDAEPEEFVSTLADRVETERDAERESNIERALRESPAEIRSNGGDAIPSVLSRGRVDGDVYRFELAADADAEGDDDGETDPGGGELHDVPRRHVQSTFGIHEDNEVLLTAADDPPDAFPVRATVSDITRGNIYLNCSREATNDPEFQSHMRRERTGYGIAGVLNPVPFDRERRAVEALDAGSPFREALAGAAPLTFTDSAAARSEQLDPELNQDQQRAVEHALSADRLFCIHGPPGTGKTRTLVEIIRRAAAAGLTVLVCADSNRAVDNIVVGSGTAEGADERSLHAHGQHGTGEFRLRRHNARRSSSERVREAYASVRDTAHVVASTNGSAATLDRAFDVAVVDEATQATIPSTCIPLARAHRAILAGDHRQLPPYSATEEPPEETASAGTGISLFEHLYSDGGVYEGVGTPLRTQYRMHRDIAYYPNRRFYDGILESGRPITALPDRPALVGYDIGGSESVVRSSTANSTEARLVARLAEDSLGDDIAPDDVGIITPYTAQKYEIADELDDAAEGVTVDTIDAFQGSEKEAVFISLVRSNDDGRIGFLGRPEDGPRRLNVAMTRAQRFCAIVGDWHTLTREREESDKCTDLYRSLHSHLDDTGRFHHVEPEFISAVGR